MPANSREKASKQTGESEEIPATEQAIDEVLDESFPASDSPPWTLGLERHSAYVADADEPDGTPSKRGSTG